MKRTANLVGRAADLAAGLLLGAIAGAADGPCALLATDELVSSLGSGYSVIHALAPVVDRYIGFRLGSWTRGNGLLLATILLGAFLGSCCALKLWRARQRRLQSEGSNLR